MNDKQKAAGAQAWRVARALQGAMVPAKGNSVWSPACVTNLLSLVREGSSGITLQELNQLMGAESFLAEQDPFGLILEHGWHYDGYDSSIASAVWLSEAANPEEGFLKTCDENAIKIAIRDLTSVGTSQEIAAWIAEQTRGLLSPSVDLSPTAMACLVSALYLKDAWDDPFEDCDTEIDDFHSPNGDVKAAFMKGRRDCRVIEGNNCTAVSVMLSSGAEMCFVLPVDDKCDSMEAMRLFEALGSERPLVDEPVDLSIPRFECESNIDAFESLLKAAGISSAASMELLPMTGINPTPTQMVHGAKLKVNEAGMEAGAYTMMIACMGLPPEDPPEPRKIVLDRPFYVAVLSQTGAPLFIGSVEEPLNDTIVWRDIYVDDESLVWRDEEIEGWCRVTVEADEDFENHEITCGIYGSMVHTVFASSYDEAKKAYDSIKRDFEEFVRLSEQDDFDTGQWIDGFVSKW